MADVASNLYSWSTTASSNSPSGATNVGSGLDDNLREIQKVVREGLAHYNSTPVSSSGTVDLGASTGNFIIISGTTTITSFGTVSAGIWKVVRFSGALTLTYNATSLILPSAANITTVAGDVACFLSEGSGNWRCVWYMPTDGRAVVNTVLDSEFQILDNSDTTKIAVFQASGITTGTTRTFTFPNASTTLVGTDATQTLTAKTLTSPTINTPTINTATINGGAITFGTKQDTTSGTAINFTSIPSWVKKIVISISALSTDGTGAPIIQIGDAGGYEATGYTGTAWNMSAGTGANLSAGFAVWTGTWAATTVAHGIMTLALIDSTTNTWACSSAMGLSNAANLVSCAGTKSLSATLDSLRLTTSAGTDNFDAGSINILYE